MQTYVRITYGARTLTRGGGLTKVMPYNITSEKYRKLTNCIYFFPLASHVSITMQPIESDLKY